SSSLLDDHLLFIHYSARVLTLFSLNDPATPEIYTLSLHDALPILMSGVHDLRNRGVRRKGPSRNLISDVQVARRSGDRIAAVRGDRKSTRLNSSHLVISYAVFCLKKKILN